MVFGAPPIATLAQMGETFLPEPAAGALFREHVTEAEAEAAAKAFLAPGSTLDISAFVADILATDGAARTGLSASVGAGRFADEIAVVSALHRPPAVLQGGDEQLISTDYLRKLSFPALWRGEVQVLPGVGHAPHQEAPEEFAALLAAFLDDLEAAR